MSWGQVGGSRDLPGENPFLEIRKGLTRCSCLHRRIGSGGSGRRSSLVEVGDSISPFLDLIDVFEQRFGLDAAVQGQEEGVVADVAEVDLTRDVLRGVSPAVLVGGDRLAGETIAPNENGWGDPSQNIPSQVDFRYIGDNALFLTLDGGIKAEPLFEDIDQVKERGYRITDLDKRASTTGTP